MNGGAGVVRIDHALCGRGVSRRAAQTPAHPRGFLGDVTHRTPELHTGANEVRGRCGQVIPSGPRGCRPLSEPARGCPARPARHVPSAPCPTRAELRREKGAWTLVRGRTGGRRIRRRGVGREGALPRPLRSASPQAPGTTSARSQTAGWARAGRVTAGFHQSEGHRPPNLSLRIPPASPFHLPRLPPYFCGWAWRGDYF